MSGFCLCNGSKASSATTYVAENLSPNRLEIIRAHGLDDSPLSGGWISSRTCSAKSAWKLDPERRAGQGIIWWGVDGRYTTAEAFAELTASCASRQTMVSGNAVLAAADEIRDTLLTLAARKIKAAKDRLDLRNGRLLVDGEVHDLTVKNLAERASVWGYPLHAQSRYHLEYPDDAPEVTYRFSSEFFQFCTQIAQVLVDCETGQVTVEKLVAVHDAGKIINPGGVFGQIEGGIAQGIGYALSEELVVEAGITLNPSLENYVIPLALDIPELDMHVLEMPELAGGPLGAKGVAEGPIIPTAPAIRNAILDAIGKPLYRLPMKPERVLAAIDG